MSKLIKRQFSPATMTPANVKIARLSFDSPPAFQRFTTLARYWELTSFLIHPCEDPLIFPMLVY
jgi:hypothetical protein